MDFTNHSFILNTALISSNQGDYKTSRVVPSQYATVVNYETTLPRKVTHTMKYFIQCFQALLALIIFISLPTFAYTLTPTTMKLKDSGSESSGFMQLANKGTEPEAIQFTIYEHSKDPDGKAIRGNDASDQFIIYPHQVVMMPGDEVSVQVLWVGESILDAEQAFTLLSQQIPVPRKVTVKPDSIDKLTLDIRILMNYEGRVYITPLGAKADIITTSVNQVSGTNSPEMIEIIFENQGTAHASTSNMSLVFIPLDSAGAQLKQQAITLDTGKIPAMRSHLLAGGKRRLVIPRPAGLKAGQFDVILSQ